MANINDVMYRLYMLQNELCLRSDMIGPRIARAHAEDLDALLSYTKQCREALEPFGEWSRLEELHGSTIGHEDVQDDRRCRIEFGSLVVLGPTAGQFRAARQALSTQPGERE